jgi:hypothetical protein
VAADEEERMSAQRTLSRRGFIGAGAGLAAAAALGTAARPALGTHGSSAAKAPPGDPPLLPADRIGIQPVRDHVSSIGFAKVFEALAKLGYKQVEFAGYTQGTTSEITTAQIRKLMDANGLTG